MNIKLLLPIIAMTIIPVVYADTVTVTSQDYVDNVMNTKQNKIAATSGDRVITYGSTAGEIGSRGVLTDLTGVTTSDTNLVTAEAAANAAWDKQVKVNNLSNRNVLMYGGYQSYWPYADDFATAPIYDSTVNTFGNGLVEAGTLNAAMTTAANNEMVCHEYIPNVAQTPANCMLWEINTSATAPLTTTAYLPANVNGTNRCWKGINGSSSSGSGLCPEVYNTLNTGGWAVNFPYGLVTGISVCSNIEPSIKYDDYVQYPYQISTNQSGVQSQYDAWVSAGRPATPVGEYCYCKLATPSIAAAKWVFPEPTSSASICAGNCASICALYVSTGGMYGSLSNNFRGAMFGAVAQ